VNRDLSIILEDMLEGIDNATILIGDLDSRLFAGDLRTREAIFAIVIKFGEAATVLLRDYPELEADYPALPLRAAKEMRNRLIHGYWSVDYQILYDVATIDLPNCKYALQAIAQRFSH
jgi:uncharacterized protein with HEPN domain